MGFRNIWNSSNITALYLANVTRHTKEHQINLNFSRQHTSCILERGDFFHKPPVHKTLHMIVLWYRKCNTISFWYLQSTHSTDAGLGVENSICTVRAKLMIYPTPYLGPPGFLHLLAERGFLHACKVPQSIDWPSFFFALSPKLNSNLHKFTIDCLHARGNSAIRSRTFKLFIARVEL